MSRPKELPQIPNLDLRDADLEGINKAPLLSRIGERFSLDTMFIHDARYDLKPHFTLLLTSDFPSSLIPFVTAGIAYAVRTCGKSERVDVYPTTKPTTNIVRLAQYLQKKESPELAGIPSDGIFEHTNYPSTKEGFRMVLMTEPLVNSFGKKNKTSNILYEEVLGLADPESGTSIISLGNLLNTYDGETPSINSPEIEEQVRRIAAHETIHTLGFRRFHCPNECIMGEHLFEPNDKRYKQQEHFCTDCLNILQSNQQ